MEPDRKPENEKKEIGLYEKLALRSKELIAETKEKSSAAIDAAMEKAKEEMVVAGDFSHEQGEKLKAFLRRDLEFAKKGMDTVGKTAKEALEPHRLKAGVQGAVATILEVVGEKFEAWGAKLAADLDFRTGEISTPGSLTCKKCGNIIKLHDTGHIPPCPKCRGVEFHKSY